MKRLCLFIFIFAMVSQAVSGKEYDRDFLLRKKDKFTGMRNAGFTMGVIGSAMVLGGIVLAANGEYETVQTPTGTQQQAADGSAAGGLILLAIGLPLGVGGFVLGGIGNRKVHQYERLLEGVSVDMELGEDRKGLRLSYSF